MRACAARHRLGVAVRLPSGLAQLAHAASVAASAWLRTSRQRSAGSLSYETEDGASGTGSGSAWVPSAAAESLLSASGSDNVWYHT